MTTVQTETLSDNLFVATYDEMADFGRGSGALTQFWEDEAGKCLSMIDVHSA